ncbi:hypothetical protein [Helicobacter typhlonius]
MKTRKLKECYAVEFMEGQYEMCYQSLIFLKGRISKCLLKN